MFVATIPAKTSEYINARLRRRFNVMTLHYNAVLAYGRKCVRKLHSLPEWEQNREINQAYRSAIGKEKSRLKQQRDELWKVMREKSGFSEKNIVKYGYAIVRKRGIASGAFLDEHSSANECNRLSKRAYLALEKYVFHRAKRVNFVSVEGRRKKIWRKCLTCISNGKSSTSPLRLNLKDRKLVWKKLEIPLLFQEKDLLHQYVLEHPDAVGEVKLTRERQKDRWQYYVQITMDGDPPRKTKKWGKGKVGLDIGPSAYAYVGNTKAELEIFCKELKCLQKDIRILSRHVDRQRRANNRDCYDEKGRIIKGKHPIRKSRRQRKSETELAEIQRKEKEFRRCLLGRLTNELRKQGDVLCTEKLNIKSWQKRRKTKKGSRGGFGKSLRRNAPGMFLNLLKNKFESTGGKYEGIDVRAKLSQTCPKCGAVKKKDLSERIHKCDKCGYEMQRDLTSAALACAVENGTVDVKESQKIVKERGLLLREACLTTSKFVIGRRLSSVFGSKSELERIALLTESLAGDAPPLAGDKESPSNSSTYPVETCGEDQSSRTSRQNTNRNPKST
jgi:transposase